MNKSKLKVTYQTNVMLTYIIVIKGQECTFERAIISRSSKWMLLLLRLTFSEKKKCHELVRSHLNSHHFLTQLDTELCAPPNTINKSTQCYGDGLHC
jgi:hypothetical protein